MKLPVILPDGMPATGCVRVSALYEAGGPFYGASRSTVWSWIASGRLPTIKLGPRITAVFVDDVRALILRMQTTSSVVKADTS